VTFDSFLGGTKGYNEQTAHFTGSLTEMTCGGCATVCGFQQACSALDVRFSQSVIMAQLKFMFAVDRNEVFKILDSLQYY